MPYSDPLKKAAWRKRYLAENRDRIRAYQKKRNADLRGPLLRPPYVPPTVEELERRAKRHLETNRAWYARMTPEQRAKRRKSNSASARRHPPKETNKAAAKLWRAANKDRVREYAKPSKLARKARRRGATQSDIRAYDLKKLLIAQKGRCVYCSVVLDKDKHLDHILPLALGGQHLRDNVQYLCGPCNVKKGAIHPDQYEASIGFKREISLAIPTPAASIAPSTTNEVRP